MTEEQLRQWLSEGRANGQTLIRFNDGPWKPLSTFPEFAASLGAAAPPAAPGSSIGPAPLPPTSTVSNGTPANNGMAITGLIFGILGLFCCGPIFSTLGLVFSVIGLSQINQNPMKYTGKGIAIAGIVLSLAGYVLFALLLATGVLGRTFRNFPRRF